MHRLMLTIILVIAVALPVLAGDIHRAIEAGDLERVTTLLDDNPKLLVAEDEGTYRDRPLHVAAAGGHLEIARLLLDRGADVDVGDSDLSTPLQVAAVRRQPDMVSLLLDRGADPNFQDNNGAWSLSFAASARDSVSVERLLAAGARLDLATSDGLTVLHYAVRVGLNDLIARALAAGVDPCARTTEGESVLHWAAIGNQVPVLEQLVSAGADVNAVDNHGSTSLSAAAWRGRVEAITWLAEHGADVNVADDRGRTVLSVTAAEGEVALIKTLLEHGADADHQTDRGETPLWRAAKGGNIEVARALLAAGARPDVRKAQDGCTPLHVAAMRGYGDVVECLAAATPNLNACNAAEETALDLAARYGHADIASILATGGARQEDPPAACPAEAGCLATCAKQATDDQSALAVGEARYWYLGHSGYAFQTRNHLLIFDYFAPGRAPDQPALCNGFIDPQEIAGQNVTVFVSHEHRDHFDPAIFAWADEVPNIRYLMGCEAETEVPYELLPPREVRKIDGMTVRTIESNDSGLGFLVEVDGVVIFHPGDHANRQRDFSGPYAAEIDWLAKTAPRPDLAVMPVNGCNFGDLEAVRLGVHYAFDKLQPRVFLPAHALDNESRYDAFVAAARDESPGVRMIAPDHRGDHYRYANTGDLVSQR